MQHRDIQHANDLDLACPQRAGHQITANVHMRGTGGGQRDRPASCIHHIYAAKVQGGAGFADKFIITGQKTRLYRGTRTVQITAKPRPMSQFMGENGNGVKFYAR